MTNSEEEKKYDLIERYVNKLLSGEELTAFEVAMSQDPGLRMEVELYKDAQELILDQGILNVKVKLKEIHQKETGKMNGRRFYLPGALLVMVSATLVYMYVVYGTTNSATEKNQASNAVVEQPATSQNTVVTKDDHNTSTDLADTKKTVVSSTLSKVTTSQPDKDTLDRKAAPVVAGDDKPVVKENKTTTLEPVKTATNTTSDKMDCASIVVTGSVTVKETCIDESNGNIIVDLGSVKGGKQPYKYAIDQDELFMSTSQFTDLSAGVYDVLVQDKNGCVSKLKRVEVKSKICLKEEAFKPGYGEEWTIPVKPDFNGELQIVNRVNEKVYTVFIKNGYPEKWNGTDNNGMPLPAGPYLYTLISEKGALNQGHLSILR